MKKSLALGLIGSSLVIMLVFQNCAPSGFRSLENSGSIGMSSNIPLPTGDKVASFDIRLDQPESKLSMSGIISMMNKTGYKNFKEYLPQYPLYSDASDKRRFIYLPSGTSVDTTNPDEWLFPRGTIFWKEFSINGKKVETRVWEKMSPMSGTVAWRPSLYVWRADQSDADLLTVDDFYTKPVDERIMYQAGLIETQYRLLKVSSCNTCHASKQDVPLGFDYLQLSKREAAVNIFSLGAANLLSRPPVTPDEIKGSQKAKDAIGYMQTNCASCHNGVINRHNFRHTSSSTSYANERLIIDISMPQGAQPLVTFGDLANSRLYQRVLLKEMPKINPLTADPLGLKVISDWILEGDLR